MHLSHAKKTKFFCERRTFLFVEQFEFRNINFRNHIKRNRIYVFDTLWLAIKIMGAQMPLGTLHLITWITFHLLKYVISSLKVWPPGGANEMVEFVPVKLACFHNVHRIYHLLRLALQQELAEWIYPWIWYFIIWFDFFKIYKFHFRWWENSVIEIEKSA